MTFLSPAEIFRGSDAPLYRKAWAGCLSLGSIWLAGTILQTLQYRWSNETKQELVRVVGCQCEIGLPSGERLLGISLGSCKDCVADNGTEAVDLSTKLNLDRLARLQCGFGLLGV